MAHVIGVVNQKGGVGKTTVSTNIATQLALAGHKVLLVDADTQGSSSDWSMMRSKDDPAIVEVRQIDTLKGFEEKIEKLKPDYDFIIIDGAPRTDRTTRIVIDASEAILIPVTPSPFDFFACNEIHEMFLDAKKRNKKLKAFFVLNRLLPRSKVQDEVIKSMKSYENIVPLKTQLSNYTAYPQAAMSGKGVSEINHPQAKEQVEALVVELLERMKK